MILSTLFIINLLQWKLPKMQSLTKLVDDQKFGDKKICVITGTSSGLGKQTTKHLLRNGGWHVICAVRDVDKMNLVAEEEGFDPTSFTVMKCDLASFQSVRDFVGELKEFKAERPIDRLVCNAAMYQPSLPYAKYSTDGIEMQMQTNYLSHFLLSSLLVRHTIDIIFCILHCMHHTYDVLVACASIQDGTRISLLSFNMQIYMVD